MSTRQAELTQVDHRGQRVGRSGRQVGMGKRLWQRTGLLAVGLWMGLLPGLAGDTVLVAPDRFGYDPGLGLLVVAMTGDEVNAQWGGEKVAVEAGQLFLLEEPVQEMATGHRYIATDMLGNELSIFLTELPLIQISTEEEVQDEPKVPGLFSLWSAEQVIADQALGIEYRGGYSQGFPKKSMLIEFHQADDPGVTVNIPLLGLRSDDDWNLQAMFLEPLRLRNVVAQELWMDLHQPYYAFLEPEAQSGVRHAYAELFLNGSYRGLYSVGERVDRKQLQLKSYNGTVRGELFKGKEWGVPTLTTPPPPYEEGAMEWAGFKAIHPTEEPAWGALSEFIDFVVSSPDELFYEQVDLRFYRGNAIDYFLFLNLLRAVDNTGKNIFIARYREHEPYFYVPWDLDGILGLFWDGSLDTAVTSFLSNGLYDRWIEDYTVNGFRDAHCVRWWQLRQSLFTTDAIMQRFVDKHARLAASGVYDREEMAWPEYHHDPGHLDFMAHWLDQRLAFLDDGMEATCAALGVAGAVPGPELRAYPNPATDRLTVECARWAAGDRVELFDALGRLQLSATLAEGRTVLDVGDKAPGTYILRVLRAGSPVAHLTVMVR